MAWFDKTQEDDKYVLVAIISKEWHGYVGRTSVNYSMKNVNGIPFSQVSLVLKKMLEKIDDNDLVTLKEFERERNYYDSSNARCGGPVNACNRFFFYVLKEDIPKIEADEPIHVHCIADEFPDDKEKFLEMVKMFLK